MFRQTGHMVITLLERFEFIAVYQFTLKWAFIDRLVEPTLRQGVVGDSKSNSIIDHSLKSRDVTPCQLDFIVAELNPRQTCQLACEVIAVRQAWRIK